MKVKSLAVALVVLVACMGCGFSVFAQMTSTNFQIQWDSFSSGGDDSSSSTSYLLRDMIGGTPDSQASSASYLLDQGYRAGVYDRVADFSIYLEDRSSQVSAISVSGTTVTVSSVAGFSTGDIVTLVEEEGASQISAIGKITSILDPDITVDEWHYAASMPSVNGNNDYLYALNGSSATMPEPTVTMIATTIIGWEVTADVDDGYRVYIFENQNLTNGTDTITDVADGEVSVGSREYGARSSDTSLATSTFDTQDTAITSNLQQVASRSGNSFSSRNFLTLKSSRDGLESSGTYSHTITLIYVGDY